MDWIIGKRVPSVTKHNRLHHPVFCLLFACSMPFGVLADGHGSHGTDLSNGEEIFETCAICHGANAGGGEDFEAPKLAGQYDWYLMTQLRNFREGARGTHDDDVNGQIMQPMAEDLTDEDIADVVAYIMTLDGSIPEE